MIDEELFEDQDSTPDQDSIKETKSATQLPNADAAPAKVAPIQAAPAEPAQPQQIPVAPIAAPANTTPVAGNPTVTPIQKAPVTPIAQAANNGTKVNPVVFGKTDNIHNPFLRILAKMGQGAAQGATIMNPEVQAKAAQDQAAQKTAEDKRFKDSEIAKNDREANKSPWKMVAGDESIRTNNDTNQRERLYENADTGQTEWRPEGSSASSSAGGGGATPIAAPQVAPIGNGSAPAAQQVAPITSGGSSSAPAVNNPSATTVAKPQFQYGKPAAAAKPGTPDEQALADLMTGDNGKPRTNPDTGKPFSGAAEANAYLKKIQTQAENPDRAPATPENIEAFKKSVSSYDHLTKKEAAGIVADADQARTKADLDKLSARALQLEGQGSARESAHEMASANKQAGVDQKLSDAVTKDWADPQHGFAGTLAQANLGKESIKAGASGDGLATSLAPTMEVLGMNSFAGTHRISPAEASAAGAPGGWSEQFNAWLDKSKSGKLTPQLAAEGQALMDRLVKAKYNQTLQQTQLRVKNTKGADAKSVSVLDPKGKLIPLSEAKPIADQPTGFKVGQTFTQNGKQFKATKVDSSGKVTAADPA